MKIRNLQMGWLTAAMGLVLMSGGTALADDTELFLADPSAAAVASQPNIMFIIDTSGSMDSDVTTQLPYDPATAWPGCYETDGIYYKRNSSNPGCSTNDWFNRSANVCAASFNDLAALGIYEGDLLAYRSNRKRWVAFRSNQKGRTVECKADAGKHGSTAGTYWAADGSTGPFATSDANEPAWVEHYYLFDGNYMNWVTGGGTVIRERIEIVRDVTVNLLENLRGVNVGLMRFNNNDGGPVIYAMEDIATARDDIIDEVEGLPASGWTPLSETMYESYLYFSGNDIDYGEGYTNDSVPESRVGGTSSSNTYNSPIDYSCQKNYIVLLTDGEPTKDKGAQSDIEALPDFDTLVGPNCEYGAPYTGGSSEPDDGICLDEMAEYMYKQDISPLSDDQNVTTYTIGFTVDLDLLSSTAKKGGGDYYLADDTATLSSALTKITVSILEDASTFTAPSVPVNAFNRTQSLNDLYVSVFNPSSTVHWPGNVKKYLLTGGALIDANDVPAIDPGTGFFKDDAQSYWSTVVDGDRPPEGGAASMQPEYVDRNVYTDIAGGDLNSNANRVQLSNSSVSAAVVGAPGDVYATQTDITTLAADAAAGTPVNERDKLVAWMRGVDIFDDNDDGSKTDARRQMGDPLHVRPVPVIYGGTAAAPDMVVYVMTNDGFMHAIDPDTGEELWSWVPSRLLSMMYSKYLDQTSATRMYGLDGEISVRIVNDNKIAGITGTEKVILSFGMRRGGDSVFAVDVTDRNDPQLLWEIDSSTSGFEDLGQTWSTPQLSKVNVAGVVTDVAIFGGGYDAGQDNDTYRTDTVGNAVYMVNLLTGAKIWSAGDSNAHDLELTNMEHSIPAPLRVIDLNADGLSDRIYVGDMGGRLWRYDIWHGNAADELGTGGEMATLGAADVASPTSADIRRFYNQVDVVDYSQYGVRFLALNIGSGYRAHPMDRDVAEEFYSVRDYNPTGRLPNAEYGVPVNRVDLIDITALPAQQLDSDDAGWLLRMDASPGEKVLGRSLTLEGVVYFTSFAPGTLATACTAALGTNRLYKVGLINGNPVVNLDGSTDPELTEEDRSKLLKQGGIAPQVEILFTADDPTLGTIVIGTEVEYGGIDSVPTRTYWSQDGTQ